MKDVTRSISVLDTTLRDGGCVNDFNFGVEYIQGILTALESAGVEFVELGYVDDKKGSATGRTKYISEKVVPDAVNLNKKPGMNYLVMMDFGRFNPSMLSVCDGQGVDGVRLAFHKKDWRAAISCGRLILEKGYKLFLQPMLTMHYSDEEFLGLIKSVNENLSAATAFYIVDSFGEMRHDDLAHLVGIVDRELNPSMALGLHSHNNLQLSYSLAMTLMDMPLRRDLIIDASLMGMGKGAGNLCTELLLEQLNLYHGAEYEISPALAVIDRVIKVLRQEFQWGYSVEYYLSSVNHCTPSYASYFYNKHMLPIDQVGELLGMIKAEKRISFDEEYARELYLQYRADGAYDDEKAVAELKAAIRGRDVLIIAPGKSIAQDRGLIQRELERDGVVSIGLNNFEFETDFVFITRSELLNDALRRCGKYVITTSRIVSGVQTEAKILSFCRWIEKVGAANDSSAVMAINLARYAEVKGLVLAGFDGFSVDVNANYGDRNLRRPLTGYQVDACNVFFRDYLARISQMLSVRFLTPSLYEV